MNRSFDRRVRKILLRSSEWEAGFARTEQMPTSNRHGSAMLLLKCKPTKHPGFTPSRLLTRAEMALCELTQAFLSGILPATPCLQRKTKFEKLGEVALLQAQPVLLNFLSPS